MLPAISSLTVATGIYWWLIFVTGEVVRDATWMLIDLPLEGSCFHLPAIYLPDYSNVRQSRAVGSQASLTVSPEMAREGDTGRHGKFVFSHPSIGKMPFTLSMCICILKRAV